MIRNLISTALFCTESKRSSIKRHNYSIFISFKDDISLKSYTLLIICLNSVSDQHMTTCHQNSVPFHIQINTQIWDLLEGTKTKLASQQNTLQALMNVPYMLLKAQVSQTHSKTSFLHVELCLFTKGTKSQVNKKL